MPQVIEKLPRCVYCDRTIPQESTGADTPWLMEKASYGVNAIRWRPQSRAVWDLDKFYQFCSFACIAPMILEFVDKEKWRVHAAKVEAKEKTQ